MIELLYEVKKIYKDEGDKYFIDKYFLPNGIYIKINKNLEIKSENIMIVKSKKVEDYPFELYRWFRERTFFSNLINTDKSIDINEKKIHSINPYTIFFKGENLPNKISKLGKNTNKRLIKDGLTQKEIDSLTQKEMFEIVIKSHYEKMEDNYNVYIDYNQYKNNFLLRSNEITNICEKFKIKDKEVVKIFFDEEILNYQKFYEQYLPKIVFCSKDTIIKNNGKLVGMPNYGLTLNKDKPTLKMLNTKFKIPYLVSLEDAILLYKMSLVIREIKKETNILLNVDKNTEIIEYENINKNYKKKPYISFNILSIENEQDILINRKCDLKDRRDIAKIINRLLKNNWYGIYNIDRNGTVDYLKAIIKSFTDIKIYTKLVSNKDLFKGYFEKNYSVDISNEMEKLLDLVFEYELKNSILSKLNNKKLSKFWDEKISIIHYLSEGKKYFDMDKKMKKLMISIKDGLNEDDIYEIKDDESFYFLTGQLVHYLISQSEKKDKKGDMYTPFLNANNLVQLKDRILQSYNVYSHNLSIYDKSMFNKAFQIIMVYTPRKPFKNSEMRHMFTAGLVANNIFYAKRFKDNMEDDEDIDCIGCI